MTNINWQSVDPLNILMDRIKKKNYAQTFNYFMKIKEPIKPWGLNYFNAKEFHTEVVSELKNLKIRRKDVRWHMPWIVFSNKDDAIKFRLKFGEKIDNIVNL